MFGYRTPNVYIREESGGARPIQAVGTSTPGFIGVAPYVKAHLPEGASQPEVVAINNWSQFVKEFCVAPREPGKESEPINPDDYFASTKLSHAVYGFFLNGGGRCYVVNVGNVGAGASSASASPASDASEDSSGTSSRRKRAAVATSDQGVDDADRLPPVTEGLDALASYDDVAIVVAPCYTDKGSQGVIVGHCQNLADRVAILDVPSGDLKPTDVDPNGKPSYEMPRDNKGFGVVYYPWIAVRDPLSRQAQAPVLVPPSGHIAGVWARTDSARGVHKAPANETLRGAISLGYRMTNDEQANLNDVGMNAIRHFSREGILVWGARTISNDPEWRYVNVRRLFNMIEESIAESTRWTVFEPNDTTLWKSIRRDVGAFLTNIWRTGALMGTTPEEAFFVKCDEETNPPEVVDSGSVIIIIGIAPVKPAEFVIFRIRQASGTSTEEGA